MKYVFVRFEEECEEGQFTPSTLILRGQAANSPEDAIDFLDGGVPVRILDWYEVPEVWKNLVADGRLNESFVALLGLDALGETPVVSDLLASIFETGYRMALRKKG
ncbi:MAG: hypothetical protein QG642_190 [Patescibacteria group bacterium]|nr:hypothetical protein [Patescibacteria group bacterium]